MSRGGDFRPSTRATLELVTVGGLKVIPDHDLEPSLRALLWPAGSYEAIDLGQNPDSPGAVAKTLWRSGVGAMAFGPTRRARGSSPSRD